MGDHNFVAIPHERTPPGYQSWHCTICDTITAWPKDLDQRIVNRIMANKMMCVPIITAKPN